MWVSPAYAQASGQGFQIVSILPLILIFVIMYFLLIRPQQKKLKAHKAMVASLKRNDRVVTQGGLIGRISRVTDHEVEIEIAPEVKVMAVRATIAQVVDAENQD